MNTDLTAKELYIKEADYVLDRKFSHGKRQVSIFLTKVHNCNDCHFYPKSFIVYNVYNI